MKAPIIFCHYGKSKYLKYTMSSAKISGNQNCVLLGDKENKEIAIKSEWLHFEFNKIKSKKIDNFESIYKPISGRMHRNIKNNGNWLKFVFMRWFYIEEYCLKNNILNFYCFDSDTVILDDLSKYEERFASINATSQCEGSCLNGYVSTLFLSKYTQHILDLYSNDSFLKMQKLDLEDNKNFAFTEMRAFNDFNSKLSMNERVKPINFYFDSHYFDNALRSDEGFECVKVPIVGYRHKNIKKNNVGSVLGVKNGVEITFLTLNMSWLPIFYYRWPIKVMNNTGGIFLSSRIGTDLYTIVNLFIWFLYDWTKFFLVRVAVRFSLKI